MKRKITAFILSLSILSTSTMLYEFSYADNITDNNKVVNYNIDENQDTKQNPVVKDLIDQTQGNYKENESVTIIVEVNDETMSKKHGLNPPDIKKVRTKDGLENQIEYAKESQDLLMGEMDKTGANYTVLETYDTVLNGIAIKTNFEDAKKIAQLSEVTSVELNRTIEAPKMEKVNISKKLDETSNDMVNASDAWDRTYSGKGQLIAIIDSGADPDHEIFSNVDLDTIKIKNENEIKSIISEKNLSGGKYFNNKIPFGFNYADRNTKIKENNRRSHGMHVAGIVAANGSKLKGVAPNAQLAIMRVFSDSLFGAGTTPVIYNKAIDDAVKLGVDSINMSLGSTGNSDGRMEQTTINALRNAQEAGIVVAIAAGNDGFMGFGALDAPPSTNPDIGLIGSPAVADLSLSVASVDNVKIKQKGIIVNTNPLKRILFKPSDEKEFPTQDLNFVHVNEGYPEDFNNLNLNGKIALIKRGDKPNRNDEYSFAQKAKNAQDNGAVAAIVYNNIDERQLVHMAGFNEAGVTIPTCFISKEDGEFLLDNQNVTIRIETEESYITNPNGYNISSFSSWGVTAEGNLKPDISAPGGEIYSSLNDNSYDLMSGTSMASPHVAGGIAVAKEYVEKTFPNIKGSEKHRLIKNLLMSTASPHMDSKTKAYTSPRAQGAGLLNLNRATRAGVIAIGTNEISSINLRNISENTVNIKGSLQNYTNKQKTFEYYAVLNTDTVKDKKAILQPRLLQSTIDNKKQISVSPNGRADFEVSFTLTDEEVKSLTQDMPNGFFLEGYVFFESNEPDESINIPYVGFKGNWDELKVIDDSIYDLVSQNKRPYYYERADVVPYPFTYLYSKSVGEEIALGELSDSTFKEPKFDKNKIAFSPNGDGRGDEINFAGTFLRNYKDFEINVYDNNEKNDPIYTVSQENDFGIKNYFIPGPFGGPNLNTKKPYWKWNGRNLSSEIVKDGDYIFSVSVKPDSTKADIKTQTMDFPVIIDTVYPRIVKSSYDSNTGIYELSKVEEDGSGLKNAIITIDKKQYKPDAQGRFTLPAETDTSKAILAVSDYADNTIELPLNKSLRRGDEKTLIVKPLISSGAVQMNKFKWIVIDKNGDPVDPYDLKVGDYTLVITNVEEPFELNGPNNISFTVKEEDKDKIISVPFSYKNKKEVTITISKPNKVSMRVILIDMLTGTEYELSPKSSNQYFGNLPPGRYKTVIRDLSSDYFANIDPVELVVGEEGTIGINPSITITKKYMNKVKINVNRNNYQDAFTLVLRGKDVFKTLYTFDFAANETSKDIELPLKLKFDVYVTNINGYGIDSLIYEAVVPMKPLEINLIQGKAPINIPVEKDELQILINKAKLLKESDYDPSTWSAFEIALDKAEKIYKDSSSTQKQVNDILENLQKAIDELITKNSADKLRLKEKIEEAENIYNSLDDSYDEKSKEFLQLAIDGAKLTYRSKDPQHNTPKHINDTINMLDRAIKNLKRKDGKVDKSNLNVLLKQAEELIKNKDLYTKESIDALKLVYDIAKGHYDDENADATVIQNSISDLKLYISLVETKSNKADLKKEVDISSKIDLSNYKIEGRAEFRAALEKARQVLANNKASQEEIDSAHRNLKQKRENLVLKGKENNELFNVPVKISEKNTNSLSVGNAFIESISKVEKNENNLYTYKISLKAISFELNGKNINADITKLNIITPSGKKALSGIANNGVIQYTFESTEKLSRQDITFTIDVLDELGEEEVEGALLFDWANASK